MASGKPQTRPSVRHPSHNHPLHSHKAKVEDEIICFGCNLDLIGAAYKCTKSVCDYFLHKSCFELLREIRHKSHPNHPLTLLYSPSYHSTYTCNACGEYGSGFTYNCSICQYDVHVACVSMPESMKHDEHVHPLALVYSSPYQNLKGLIVPCDVCHETIPQNLWSYFCQLCNYNRHLHSCVANKEEEPCVADEEEEPCVADEEEEPENGGRIRKRDIIRVVANIASTASGFGPLFEEPCVADEEEKPCVADEEEKPCVADEEEEPCVADEEEEPENERRIRKRDIIRVVANRASTVSGFGPLFEEPCVADEEEKPCVADEEEEPCVADEKQKPCVADEEQKPCVADEEQQPCVADEEEEPENEERIRKRDIIRVVANIASAVSGFGPLF